MGDSPSLAFTPSLELVAGELRFIVRLSSPAPTVLLPEDSLARLLNTPRPISRRALTQAVEALGAGFTPRQIHERLAYTLPEALSVVGALLAQAALPVDARWMPAVLRAFQAAEKAAAETLQSFAGGAPRSATPPPAVSSAPDSVRTLEAEQRREILDALEATNWSRTKTAERLGIPRRTLYRRMSNFGILEGARPRGTYAQRLRGGAPAPEDEVD